jgi:hypothetical protein
MGERRSEQIMIAIEPTFRKVLNDVLTQYDLSASSYFRQLMLADLKTRGLLTSERIDAVLSSPRASVKRTVRE